MPTLQIILDLHFISIRDGNAEIDISLGSNEIHHTVLRTGQTLTITLPITFPDGIPFTTNPRDGFRVIE